MTSNKKIIIAGSWSFEHYEESFAIGLRKNNFEVFREQGVGGGSDPLMLRGPHGAPVLRAGAPLPALSGRCFSTVFSPPRSPGDPEPRLQNHLPRGASESPPGAPAPAPGVPGAPELRSPRSSRGSFKRSSFVHRLL